MTHAELLEIIRRIAISAEQLAPRIGVSNMTIRRWQRADPRTKLSATHQQLVVQGVERLLGEGIIPADTAWAQKLVSENKSESITAALAGMGVHADDLKSLGSQRQRMIGFLRKIGLSPRHQGDVDKGQDKIAGFKNMGLDWKLPINTLLKVIRSKKLTQPEKLVAYGALFYLLCPLDLIPDSVPLFGFADDFVFLSLAAGYYVTLAKKKEA